MDSFLTRLKNKDEEAFQILYDDYVKLVYHIAYSYTRRREDAEDITIDVFNKIYNSIDSYQETGKLKEWISMIARNTANNHVTRDKFKNVISDDEIVSSTKSSPLEHRDMLELFNDYLDEETKQIMILKFIYNYSFKEISKMTNKTIGQIQGLYYDGIDKLKRGVKHD